MDLSFRQGHEEKVPKLTIQFQSLFWWICHFDRLLELHLEYADCFNPCFDGFVISTFLGYFDTRQFFVSILVLMDLSFRLLCSCSMFVMYEVSILVLMDLSFRPENVKFVKTAKKFQSLFWWICHFDQSSFGLKIANIDVSILVLMDLSFRQKTMVDFYQGYLQSSGRSSADIQAMQSFNPCFDGFVISTRVEALFATILEKFQSLFWWICHFDSRTT